MNSIVNHERRHWLKKLLAVAFGLVSGLIPTVAGLLVWLDPLWRRGNDYRGLLWVASLEALPADGQPRKFAVIGAQSDAWNKSPAVPVGAVYLRRRGTTTVQAFNAICPHAGCFVDYLPEQHGYLCPCHRSTYDLDGQIKDPRSPAPRGLDALEVEIRNRTEIWVKFQNYLAGQKTKQPTS